MTRPWRLQFLAGDGQADAEQEKQYAYKTTLMNDVHMSHAMEFPYPQSMSSCVTCHAGKLDTVLADDQLHRRDLQELPPCDRVQGRWRA